MIAARSRFSNCLDKSGEPAITDNKNLDVVPKLVAAFLDTLMFFSKGPLGVSEARGPGFTGKEKNIGE